MMRRLQCALLATIAAIGFVSIASAADMPVKAPAAAPLYNWAGFYVGVNGGYGWSGDVGAITYTNSAAQTFTSTGSTFNDKGGFGGGQIGYNWQMGHIVYGLEADIQAASIKSDISGGVTGFGDLYVGTRKLNYFGTARGRIGYAFDRTLLYATGGFVYGRVQTDVVRTTGLPTNWVVSSTDNAGYVVGAGAEYAFAPAWSVKAEYQYLNFGSRSLSGIYQNTTTTLQSNAIAQHYHTARLGLNFKFN
jgi:outer membrane immunogenic protein